VSAVVAVVTVVAAVMTPAVAEAIVAVHRRVAAIDGSHFAGVADGFGRRALFANRRRSNGFAAFANRLGCSELSITPAETVTVAVAVVPIAAMTAVMPVMTMVSAMATMTVMAVATMPAVTTLSLSRTRAHDQGDGDQQTGERQEFNEAKHDSFSSE
jgi:hypothetical protein